MADVTTNLELYLPLTSDTLSGSTFTDLSGNSRDGTSANVPTLENGPYGVPSGAMTFNGSSDQVTVGGTALTPTYLSISAWVRSASNATTMQIATKDNGSTQRSWQFRKDATTGFIRLIVFPTGGGIRQFVGNVDCGNDTWHFVTAQWDGAAGSVSVDGIIQGADSGAADTVKSSSATLYIGRTQDSGVERWSGAMAHVRAYSRALVLADIQQAMLDGSAPGNAMLLGLFDIPR